MRARRLIRGVYRRGSPTGGTSAGSGGSHSLEALFSARLRRRVESPRFRRVETLDPDAHIHTLRLRTPAELDAELAGWIREAYTVGGQERF